MKKLLAAMMILAVITVLSACGGGGGGSSSLPSGVLTINVTSAGSNPVTKIQGARVTVIDGDTGGAVTLVPPVISAGAVTFKWNAYPSTKNYVLEVTDENGNFVWGGKAPVAGSNYAVGTATQVTYPATAPALNGTYRVRVNASVDSNVAPFYTLISATEDLEGVFTVVP